VPDPWEWRRLIEEESQRRALPIRAEEFLAAIKTQTMPVVLLCSDGEAEAEYVVKAKSSFVGWRSLFNEQVIGTLGRELGAPVPQVAIVDVPNELIKLNFSMSHMLDGVAHGSRLLRSVVNMDGVRYCAITENRPRYARLALLYGWVGIESDLALDFLYDQAVPQLVHSVDHGDFFRGGPEWRIPDLVLEAPPQPNPQIRFSCGLRSHELRDAAASLRRIGNDVIASAIAAPHERWEVPMQERTALAEFLASRRDQLLTIFDRVL